jgi:antirestriction protein ArdC
VDLFDGLARASAARRFASSPINATSRKAYRGINTACLWAAAEARGYESGEWAAYQQWKDRGGQVRKGEKPTMVVFWKFANGTTENQDDEGDHPAISSRLLFTRGHSVFNAAQVDGYAAKPEPVTTLPDRIERADAWFQSIGADVRNGGNRAYYTPADDRKRSRRS